MDDKPSQVKSYLEQKGLTKTLNLLKEEVNNKQSSRSNVKEFTKTKG